MNKHYNSFLSTLVDTLLSVNLYGLWLHTVSLSIPNPSACTVIDGLTPINHLNPESRIYSTSKLGTIVCESTPAQNPEFLLWMSLNYWIFPIIIITKSLSVYLGLTFWSNGSDVPFYLLVCSVLIHCVTGFGMLVFPTFEASKMFEYTVFDLLGMAALLGGMALLVSWFIQDVFSSEERGQIKLKGAEKTLAITV